VTTVKLCIQRLICLQCHVKPRSSASNAMSTVEVLAAVVACFSLTWSRGTAADDVIVSTTWLYEHLSSVFVLEATYNISDQQTNIEHIPGQTILLCRLTN